VYIMFVKLKQTTAAEYYAKSEIKKEEIFANNLLEEMLVQLQFQVINMFKIVGTISLANKNYNCL
jgi:hypothetical protein